MADYNYYPSAQFSTMLEQRHHDDKFISEAILITQAADIDIADFMRQDIVTGNTHTLRSAFRKSKDTAFDVQITNGSIWPPAEANHGPIWDHTMYGCAPIKDDHSGEKGYDSLPDDDERKKDVEKLLKAMNMKLDDVAPAILDPEDIPAIDSTDFKPYRELWEGDEELQAEYPTLEAFRQSLVEDLETQRKDIKDISDVNVGIFGLGSTLGEANVVAIYHTMAHIYPQITYNGALHVRPKDFPVTDYMFEYHSGDFTAVCGWQGWSHVIRKGVVRDKWDGDVPRWKKGKSNFRYLWGDDAKISISSGDPIHGLLMPNVLEQTGWQYFGTSGQSGGMLELQVQLTQNTYGEIRIWNYGTLHAVTGNDGKITTILSTIGDGAEAWEGDSPISITSDDTVTVADGSTDITRVTTDSTAAVKFTFAEGYDEEYFSINNNGDVTANNPLDYSVKNIYYLKVKADSIANYEFEATYTKLTIVVENTDGVPEPPESDDPFEGENQKDKGYSLILFPIEYKAAKEVPFFKRERFLRESVVIGIYATKKVKIKWYEKGWFKVAMFIVAVLFAWISGGASMKAYAVIEAVIDTVITMIVAQAVSLFLGDAISSPVLAAIIMIAVAYYGNSFNFDSTLSNLADIATQAMKAGEMYQKKVFQEKMEILEEEMEQFKKDMGEMQDEIEDLMEKFGEKARSDAKGFVRFLASLAKVETSDDFMDRTLNLDNAIIDNMENSLDLDSKLKTW